MLDPVRFSEMEEEVIHYSVDISRKRDEFFTNAKHFIMQTIQE